MVSVLALMMIAATAAKEPFEASWFAKPQRLVDVGGRRMNIFCLGAGSPTVILEAGLGLGSPSWALVERPIAQHTRVCAYDRAGMGFSDATTSARDAQALAGDLHALLRRAGIAPPYVLVGHSNGGLYTRLYSDRYPQEVAGLVLVDPSTEYDAQLARRVAPGSQAKSQREFQSMLRSCAINIQKCALFPGIDKFNKELKNEGCPRVQPQACALNAALAKQDFSRPSYWNDMLLEALAIPKSDAQVQTQQRPYGDLPLIVLTAGMPDDSSGPITPAQQRALWAGEKALHDRIASLSSHGAHFVVAGAGHCIQCDRPFAVVSAVDEIVDEARQLLRTSPGHLRR